jgi:integral membrane protein
VRATILTAYRVMSYVTGVLLVILVFVGLPLKYAADSPDVVAVVGTAHGFLFMVYVVLVLALGFVARWSIGKIVGVALAGTIPLAVFFVEPRVVRTERADLAVLAARQAAGGTGGAAAGTSPV